MEESGVLRGSQPLSPLLLQPDRGIPGLRTYGLHGALQCGVPEVAADEGGGRARPARIRRRRRPRRARPDGRAAAGKGADLDSEERRVGAARVRVHRGRDRTHLPRLDFHFKKILRTTSKIFLARKLRWVCSLLHQTI